MGIFCARVLGRSDGILMIKRIAVCIVAALCCLQQQDIRAQWLPLAKPVVQLPTFTNVASRGMLPNNTTGTSGANTRFKARCHYRTGINPVSKLALPFVGWTIASGAALQVNAPFATKVGKIAIEYNGTTAPDPYQGSRSFTVSPSTAIQFTDVIDVQTSFGVASIPANSDVWVRVLLDVIPGQTFINHSNNIEDVAYRYNPSGGNGSDDVDSTGVMAVPTGSGIVIQAAYCPVGLWGLYTVPTKSLIAFGDSIADGTNDALSDANGGGWIKRGAWTAGIGVFAMATGGVQSSQWTTESHTKLAAFLPYFTDAIVETGFNDLGAAGTPLLVNPLIWSDFRAAGIARVYQSLITPKTSATDTTRWTDLANQNVTNSAFFSGGFRDQLNVAFAAAVGSGIDGVLDVTTVVNDPTDHTKFALRTSNYTSTLAAAYTGAATTITLTAAPNVGEWLAVSSAGTFDAQMRRVNAVSGAGPFTVTLGSSNITAAGFTSSHSNGDPIYGIPTADGTHETDLVHAAMAAAVSTFFAGVH